MQRQNLVYGCRDLRPPAELVAAVRHPAPNVVAAFLAENADWAWADHLFHLACRVPGYEGHGGQIDERDKQQPARIEVVDLLVCHGAPPTLRNNRKVTPLHMACRFDLPQVAARLLQLGAQQDAYDEARETPLYRAVNLGYGECVAVLLSAGANIDFRNRRGETPLHRAAKRGKRALVPLLLAAGADPRIEDRAGNAPFDYARNKDIRSALQEALR